MHFRRSMRNTSRGREKITVADVRVVTICCCYSVFLICLATFMTGYSNNANGSNSMKNNGIGILSFVLQFPSSVEGLSLSTTTTTTTTTTVQSQRHRRRQSSLSFQYHNTALFNDANHNTFSRTGATTKRKREHLLQRHNRHNRHNRQQHWLSNRHHPITHTEESIIAMKPSSSPSFDADDDVKPSSSSSLKQRMVHILTGQKTRTSSSSSSSLKRPKCLQSIIDNDYSKNNSKLSFNKVFSKLIKLIPTWIFHLRSSTQLIITFLVYIFHTVILTQNSLLFPFQLIGNNRGYYSSIGYDTLAGITTLGIYQYIRYCNNNQNQKSDTTTTTDDEELNNLPDLLSKPSIKDMPWKNIWKSKYSRISSLFTFLALVRTYFFTGRISLFWEDQLYLFARYANWMTTPMHKSLCVLMGHTTWIVLASMILRLIPRPQPFFQQPKSMWFTSQYKNKSKSKSDNIANNETSSIESKQQQWIWWVLGGYFVSCWLYNISDILNSYIFPLSILLQAEENSVVGSLLNTFDVKASLIGYIAPCITAPWFEEILYRGYLLPTLLLWLPSSRSKSKNSNSSSTSLKQPSKDSSNKSSLSYQLAIFISGILFSIHHQSELAFLPLCILGWLWAIIYTKSGNLWTTILIHSMWNSRIFIGGWFGL